jgi:hypothetical protein
MNGVLVVSEWGIAWLVGGAGWRMNISSGILDIFIPVIFLL